MSWKTALLREVKGLADDIVRRVAKQFEGQAETTENVAKAARMAKRLQTRKVANPPTKPLARAPRAQMPAEKPKPKAQMPKPLTVRNAPKALPKPGPGLPEGASKPRGGQFWPDIKTGMGSNISPESAARRGATGNPWFPEPEGGGLPLVDGPEGSLSAWMEKALGKYYKRDFGAPEDPLRDLAVKGLHYDPDMTPERWTDTVNSFLMEDDIGYNTVPEYWENPSRTADRENLLAAAPWLAKAPVTDKLYGIAKGGLDLGHFTDEMFNALRPEQSGLPNDLAVDIGSLGRMSFPQAVERVGRINQWRAKQMEEAAAARMNSPAVHPYKDYPEDAGGLRWVELRQPEYDPAVHPEPKIREFQTMAGGPRYEMELDDGDIITANSREDLLRGYVPPELRAALQEQLKFEGDSMGHCVGGYCDDVASGASRIFSLRDAKGMPHVTVETAPQRRVFSDIRAAVGEDTANAWLDEGVPLGEMVTRAQMPDMQNIVQIKGKQNRAPNPEYLPYVQDFVKSGQWGEIGDLGNTGLVRLPDKRLIQQEQWQEGIRRALQEANATASPDWVAEQADTMTPGMVRSDWDRLIPYFDGYKRGGRVKAKMPVDLKVNTCGCGGCA